MEVRPVKLQARIIGFTYWKRKAKIYAVETMPLAVVKVWEGRYAVARAVAVDHAHETVRADVRTIDALLYRIFASMSGGSVEFHECYAYAARVDGDALLYFEADGSAFYVTADYEVYDLKEHAVEKFLGAEKAEAAREFLRAVATA